MEDNHTIKIRKYIDFRNDVTDTLKSYMEGFNSDPVMVRTGVTIDDDEMISVAMQSTTIATFRVNKDFIVNKVTVNPLSFSQPYFNISSFFKAKDKDIITAYLNSFVGIKLEL